MTQNHQELEQLLNSSENPMQNEEIISAEAV